MQIGLMSRTFQGSLDEELDAVVAAGMRQMQFDLSSAGIRGPENLTKDECKRIAAAFSSRGMTMVAVNGMFNMIDPDLERRQRGIDRLQQLIPLCSDLGTQTVALCTGSRNTRSMWLHHPDNDTPEAWNDLVATLAQLLPAAEEHGITLAFEPEVANVIHSAPRARNLIDEMGSARLKVVMDGANIYHEGELPRMLEILDQAFELLADHIALAHAKDLDHDGDAGHLPAGHGLLDYEHYLGLLNQLDFDVSIILHGLAAEQVDGCVAFLNRSSPVS